MKRISLLGLLLPGVMMFSCGAKKNEVGDTSQNALDWSGVYQFTDEEYKLPEVQLTLNENGTHKVIVSAIGEETKNTYEDGKFEWDKEGRSIHLDKQIPGLGSDHLVVGENTLFVVKGKKEDKPLDELLKFHKVQTDPELTEKYWKLISINDKKVTGDDFFGKEPHMIFKSEFGRVNGNDGCNGFGGLYELEGNSIVFDKMFSTMMACPDSFVFREFMNIINNENLTYEVKGEKLVIKSDKDALHFEVVYLK